MQFTPFPTLITNRLVLRQQTHSDDKQIFFLRSDPRILQHIDIPKAESLGDAINFIDKINSGISNNQWIQWGITLKTDDTLIGSVGFWNFNEEKTVADIGYMLHPDFQGKGIMQEAIEKTIVYAFHQIKLKSIIGCVNEKNIRSIKVLEKIGFKYDGPFEEEINYSVYSLSA